jgi:tripartite-type tricarboxylate transporter receptor subunit TctC
MMQKMLVILALSIGTASALAQTFPTKPMRIVTGGAGGGNDIAARLIAEGLTATLGQQVIVENRASGFAPGETVAKAAPDGHTIVLSGRSHWMAPLTVTIKAPYDPIRDFAPITVPASTPNVLAVHPSLPVKSVKELIALAKARPGELNYGASGQGSGPHLAAELFKSMAGINVVHVNYRAMGGVYTDLMAGQVQIAFGSAPGIMPHVQSGRLKGLAVSSAQPSPLAPGLPPIATTGLPGYDFTSPFGIFAPADTPRAIVKRLHDEIIRVLHTASVKDKLFKAGLDVVGSTPEQLAAMVKSEMENERSRVVDHVVRPSGSRARRVSRVGTWDLHSGAASTQRFSLRRALRIRRTGSDAGDAEGGVTASHPGCIGAHGRPLYPHHRRGAFECFRRSRAGCAVRFTARGDAQHAAEAHRRARERHGRGRTRFRT